MVQAWVEAPSSRRQIPVLHSKFHPQNPCLLCYTPLSMAHQNASARAAQPFSWAAFQSHVRYLSTSSQHRIRESFDLGMHLHEGQKRRSGDPYFSHCIAVAHILADMGADTDTIIAAFLHDALEDTDLSEDEIEERFGSSVCSMVVALTKLLAEDLVENPTLDEQIETIRKIFVAIQEDVRVMVIKLADRLHNMQTIQFLSEERQKSMAQETDDMYVKIADRLCMRDLRDELSELCLAVLKPKLLEKLLALRTGNEKRAQTIIGDMKKALCVVQSSLRVDPQYEANRFRKLNAQMEAGGSAVTGVPALNIVFICNDIAACYQTLGALHQIWRREHHSFDDLINAPTINGYRALHTTVILEDGTRVCCKVRTREMNDYAKRGISTLCFDDKAIGISSYLSWGTRISSLSEGTVDRSKEFWESLQSDILGESITVYGGGKAVLLPDGSTALDGALYLYGKNALNLEAVKVDGKEVALNTELVNGTSLELIPGKNRSVDREWLHWVHTGLAIAQIREGLGKESKENKIKAGKQLLQNVMEEHRKGLLEEFDSKSLTEALGATGFNSLDDACVAIAEGRMEPQLVYDALFERKTEKRHQNDAKHYVIHFSMEKDDIDTLQRLVGVYRKYNLSLGNIRMKLLPSEGSLRRFTIAIHLPTSACEELKGDIVNAGGKDVHLVDRYSHFWVVFALPLLSILWGLDCLLGKTLITAGVSPYDMTLLRFVVLFLISAVFLSVGFQLARRTVQKKWISPFNVNLWLAGVAIFLTALASYVAVQHISALAYAFCMNIGVVSIFAARNFYSDRRSIPFLITAAIFILFTLAVLLYETGSVFSIYTMTGIGCGMFFAIYSIAGSRYQQQESVSSRYPIFMFYFSLLALILSLPFLRITGFSLLESPLFLPSLAFVTFFTAVPYLIYFELLKHKGVQVAGRYIPLFLLVIFVGETLIYHSRSWFLIAPLLLAGAWALWYREYPTGPKRELS